MEPAKLLAWAAERGERFDHCILGEPSNAAAVGDTIKVGRRGSLNGTLIITGKQGHVAYPQLADNPVRGLVNLMSALMSAPLDQGSARFDPSNLEFTSIDIGNPVVNLIPGRGTRALQHPFQRLPQPDFAENPDRAPRRRGGGCTGALADRLGAFQRGLVLHRPRPVRRSGGECDQGGNRRRSRSSRRPAAPRTRASSRITVRCSEFGLVGTTMHQVDERTPVADLMMLTAVYRRILDRYFDAAA